MLFAHKNTWDFLNVDAIWINKQNYEFVRFDYDLGVI